MQGCWVCARKLTGRELPSLGELLAMQPTDQFNEADMGFLLTLNLNVVT